MTPTNTNTEALAIAEALEKRLDCSSLVLTADVERAAAELRRLAALEAELASTKKALALVQQHHATAWNRGHEAGMRASRDTVKQATDAVKRDAWGNTQLTEALLAVEAERDALRADFYRLMEKHNNLHVNAMRDRADRDALRAERDDLKRALAFTARLVQDWEQSATAIGAERDAFRANSDRYLWLRDTHGGVHEGDANWPSLVQVAWSRHGPRDEKFPDENKGGEVIDAAIDAAMKGTQ